MYETLVAVLISLLWLILFLRKAKKGIRLNREERVIAWLGVTLLIVSILFQIFQFFDITPSFLAPYSLYIVLSFAIVGIVVIALLLISRFSKKQPETTMRKTSRLRFSVNEDKRLDVWLVVFVFVICGTILILMMLSFPSGLLSPQAFFTYQIIEIIAIISGILLNMFGVWIASNLLYDMWKSRSLLIAGRKASYMRITKDFDDSFRNLKRVSQLQPKTRRMLLNDFQDKLRNLCYDYPWSEEKRIRIADVLSYIPDNLSNDPNVDFYLFMLGCIIHRDGEYTVNMVKEKFLVELGNLYNDPRFETNPNPMNLLQELHEYSEEFMIKLIDDACSITKWSNKKFQSLSENIKLWELKTKDKDALARVSQYIVQKMSAMEQNKEDEAHKRLEAIYRLTGR